MINEKIEFGGTVSSLVFNDCSYSEPKLSILIPTYNRSHLVKDAIDSALRQCTKLDYEIVVIDNDSDMSHKNELIAYVRNLNCGRIRLFFNENNVGMFGNWNLAIFLANAENITILNDDDVLGPNFIMSIENHFNFDGLIITSSHIFHDNQDLLKIKFPEKACSYKKLDFSDVIVGNPVRGSLGAVFNRQKAIDIGGYNPKCWPTSDYDFTFRYFMRHGAIISKTVTSAYRWAENESLKVNTLNDFLKNDFLFRAKIIDDMPELKKKFFHALEVYHMASMCSAYFKINPSFYIYETNEIPCVSVNKIKLMDFKLIRHAFNIIYKIMWKAFF
ncbi:glycosyltransferase family 2 protein [Aeromonas hydrophila]|uniref:glycosyltransferase family 2 protein n=1 Tax=Aeromonas TaxID=642 RepID=UPI00211D3877|nr:glycosyltransferase family 2 protein [Aeromonas hydrophila]